MFTGCPKSALEGLVALSEEWGRFTQRGIFIRQLKGEGLSPHSRHKPRWPVSAQFIPQEISPYNFRLPHFLLLVFYLLHSYFWEVTTSFYHLNCFIASLTDFRVILPPPAPKLSVLSQMARKEAISLAVEDSVLVALLWHHWSGEVAAAWRATTPKIQGPSMPSES